MPMWTLWAAQAITWVLFLIGILRYRMDVRNAQQADERRRKERDEELERMAKRVCREFTNDPDNGRARDERTREVSAIVVHDAFKTRAATFVSRERYDADREAMERRLGSVEESIRENTRELGNIGGQIATTVTTQLTAYLASTVWAKDRGVDR